LADTDLTFPFDPKALNFGYVWHCHIIDHEDNEMMRPLQVQTNPGTPRDYTLGADY
jgi:FtsP/CotA-like multicopper oxidase with cupredoxin domain